jgi:hypothetical protein
MTTTNQANRTEIGMGLPHWGHGRGRDETGTNPATRGGRALLAAIAFVGLVAGAADAGATPLAGPGVAPPATAQFAERIEYRPAVRYRGPYWHAPVPRVVARPRVRWHGYYRGEGFGPLYAGEGYARPQRPAYGYSDYGYGYGSPYAGRDRFFAPPAPPPDVPLAGDPRGAILLPPGRVPRTVVDVIHRPAPFTDAWYAWCFERYRSFDPRSGTFLGYDGRRHLCR